MNARDKIYTLDELVAQKKALLPGGIVLTNGCFDLVHLGHLRCLEYARSLGDSLVVAINSDTSVRSLKGASRPYITERERAELLAGFSCVDAVVIFSEQRLNTVIDALKPNIYAKGGDYTLDTMDQGERARLEACGARIEFREETYDQTTTSIVANILKAQK